MSDQTLPHHQPPVAEETPAEETLAEAEESTPASEEAVEATAEDRASGEGMTPDPKTDPETAAESEPAVQEAAAAEAAIAEGPPKHWYIIHTYSGFERMEQ